MPLAPSDRIGSGHSAQELQFANWWVRHRLLLRQLGYGTLVAWVIMSWGYGLWVTFDTFALSYPKELRIPARIALIAPTTDATNLATPQPLQPGVASTIPVSDNRFHALAPVSNPNSLWWAEIEYRFRTGDRETPLRKAILLPGDTRVLGEFGIAQGGFGTPGISIENTMWRRIDPAIILPANYESYKTERFPIAIDTPMYQSDLLLEGKPLGKSSFTLRNPSGYQYRDIEILTLLFRDGSLVGAQKLVVPQLGAGTKQMIEQVWPEAPQGVTRVEVQPFVNILDPNTFVRPL